MQLPFTHDQFLDSLAAYNRTLWAGALLLWLLTLAALILLVRRRLSARQTGAFLAIHWAWAGIAYHWAFFARINPAARLFGALFVVQALLLLWFGMRGSQLAVSWGRRTHQVLSAVFCVYALAYPLLVVAAGLRWPRMPSFGVPCPTTLLTVGLLLGLEPGRLRGLSAIPWVWCVIGGSAALLLGVPPDWMLIGGAVVLLWYVARPRALAGPGAA